MCKNKQSPLSWSEDLGRATAEVPDTYEELVQLGAEVLAAGHTSVDVHGEEWRFESWGLGPELAQDHPFFHEVESGILGSPSSMSERFVGLCWIGEHYFDMDWSNQDLEPLGRFTDRSDAVRASRFFDSFGDTVVPAMGGELDQVEVILLRIGCDISNPDEGREQRDWMEEWDLDALRLIVSNPMFDGWIDRDEFALNFNPTPTVALHEVETLVARETALEKLDEPLEATLLRAREDVRSASVSFAEALDTRLGG